MKLLGPRYARSRWQHATLLVSLVVACAVDERAVTTGTGNATLEDADEDATGAPLPASGLQDDGTGSQQTPPSDGTSRQQTPPNDAQPKDVMPPGAGTGDAGLGDGGTPTAVCVTGALRCDANVERSRCVDGQWQPTTPCGTAQICQSEADPPGACGAIADVCIGREPNARFCEGSRHVVCDADLLSAQVDACASEVLCNDDQGCSPPACAADEFDCQSANLAGCNAERTALEPVANCQTVELCRASLGGAAAGTLSPGTCLPPVCDPGQTRCSGSNLQVCNADRTDFDTVMLCAGATPFCDAIHLECDLCVANGRTCDVVNGRTSAAYLQCSADGHSQAFVACPDEAVYCMGEGPNAFCTAF